MELFFGYSLLKNNIYLDTLGNATQNNEAMSVMTAYLKKDFKAWKFHFDHKVLFQLSSKEDVVPLPKLALNLRYYLEAPLVKNVLTAQLGVEATFNTKYYTLYEQPKVSSGRAQDWPESDYFSACRYLKPQTALKFGIHWPFYVK